jgi:hypothetical protein
VDAAAAFMHGSFIYDLTLVDELSRGLSRARANDISLDAAIVQRVWSFVSLAANSPMNVKTAASER